MRSRTKMDSTTVRRISELYPGALKPRNIYGDNPWRWPWTRLTGIPSCGSLIGRTFAETCSRQHPNPPGYSGALHRSYLLWKVFVISKLDFVQNPHKSRNAIGSRRQSSCQTMPSTQLDVAKAPHKVLLPVQVPKTHRRSTVSHWWPNSG